MFTGLTPKLVATGFVAGLLLTSGCSLTPSAGQAGPTSELRQPEIASAFRQQQENLSFEHQAVAAANPLAAKAGQEILQAGGNALDAAIATQLVLGLVEPQSSGLGGGGFLLYWDGQQVVAWEGRETAPAAATPELFLDAEGEPLEFLQAVGSGAAVGVPGLLAMLEAAHREQGQLAWARLFEPAIRLAEDGFAVSRRLHHLLSEDPLLAANSAARNFYYLDNGEALPVGHRLKNPALAAIYRQVAQGGSEVFYQGSVARSIQRAVVNQPGQPGQLSLADLANYQPNSGSALCSSWQVYLVCGAPPPSSGQLTLMQILGILEHLDADQLADPEGFYSPQGLHLYIEASRLAFADRALYIADPAYVEAPGGDWSNLLRPAYLQERARQIQPLAEDRARAGQPAPVETTWAPQPEQPEYGTSHISVIDAEGQAVAMTSSIEQAFGSRILVDGGTGLPGGFLLNNQLTDFSFRPSDDQGRLIANRVEPGKRPRSSMSPTLVFDAHTGELRASLGSPGGAAIIHFTAKTLLGMLQWQLTPQEAINLPNLANFNSVTLLEKGRFEDYVRLGLEARGQEVIARDLTSGIQALLITPSGIQGGADPRREGWVAGD
ncbi:gamma-glutamyltransferase [Marinospirillum perlucidum]|uniref:gamma-glutamyltransferase n=1 Tax=Marinospirillum perlucidum TaxID=1982602 RepID=UPI000DF17A4A|nr:gamma-glutamyltransferase [Marinospirillum perlucidum]